jgi:hypothetical protein
MNYSDSWNATATQLANDAPLKFGWLLDGKYIGHGSYCIYILFPYDAENQTHTLFWPQLKKKVEERLKSFGHTMIFEPCFGEIEEFDLPFKYFPFRLAERIDYLEECIKSLHKIVLDQRQ